ncbi:MAG TPA: ferredoxin [candidate division Zixibacteria bacterium]|jgi:hydrogenase-4 component H|nr:ferredoxin [candidate division Zixibacteria bacterium]
MSQKLGAMLPDLIRHFFRKPATVQYPFEKLELPKKFRGNPVMDPALCIGCQMCVRDCPSEAIEIHKESEATDEAGKVKRTFSMTFYMDRCAHCAQCEEVCPKKAIHLDSTFEHGAFDRGALKVVYK